MAKITVKVEDDQGNLLKEQTYELGNHLSTIDLIESWVEKLRVDLLPEVSKVLLVAQQALYKKSGYASKGRYPVEIKTLNGSFIFQVCRLSTPVGSSHYLPASGQFKQGHYPTQALCSYCLLYAGELSYESVSHLIKERSGSSELSDQHIPGMVVKKAHQIALGQESEIQANKQLPLPELVITDLYDAAAQERYWLEDGVRVSKQKLNRDKVSKTGKERTITDAI